MNARQKQIFDYIIQHNSEKGYSPTFREIGQAVGLASTSTVAGHIQRLADKGLIIHSPASPRAIKVVEDQSSAVQVLKHNKGIPSVIKWQDRRYVFDPMG